MAFSNASFATSVLTKDLTLWEGALTALKTWFNPGKLLVSTRDFNIQSVSIRPSSACLTTLLVKTLSNLFMPFL